jgi:hypothetical protein
MLFKLANRFRRDNLIKEATAFELYLKWGPKGKHTLHSRHESVDECIKMVQKIKEGGGGRFSWQTIQDDYRVKKVTQTYIEENIPVPTIKSLCDKLPELKGVF